MYNEYDDAGNIIEAPEPETPVPYTQGGDNVAVAEYRAYVENKIETGASVPVSQNLDLLGTLREMMVGIHNIQRTQEELIEDLRLTKMRVAEQEKVNADRDKLAEQWHRHLENVEDKYSPEERAKAQAEFAQSVQRKMSGEDIEGAVQKARGQDVIRAEKRGTLRWPLEAKGYQIHGETYWVLPNGNKFGTIDNNECIITDRGGYVVDRLPGGLPESILIEARDTLRYAAAKQARTAAAVLPDDDPTGMGRNVNKVVGDMMKVDTAHGIATGRDSKAIREKLALIRT